MPEPTLVNSDQLEAVNAAKVPEAPADGTAYARKDGAWVTATSPPHDVGNLTGNVTLALSNGPQQYGVVTGDTTLQVPSGSPAAGSEIELVINDVDGSRTLDFHEDIHIPSNSSTTFPLPLTDGTATVLKLKYMGGAWCLVTLVGEYI